MTRKLEILRKIITSASISSHVHTLSFSVYSHPLIKIMRLSNFKTTPSLHDWFADNCFITSCSAPPHGGCGCIWNQRASSHSGTPEWGKGCDDYVLPCHHHQHLRWELYLGFDGEVGAVVLVARTQLHGLHLLLNKVLLSLGEGFFPSDWLNIFSCAWDSFVPHLGGIQDPGNATVREAQ